MKRIENINMGRDNTQYDHQGSDFQLLGRRS